MDPFGLKRLVRRAFSAMGYSITRKSPSTTGDLPGLPRLPIHTIIDVGANLGQFARVALNAFPQATIYCFEPQPSVYGQLEAWARTTRGRVLPFQLALGAAEGSADFIVHTSHDPSSSFLESTRLLEATYPFTVPHSSIRVAVTSLDALVRSGSVKLAPDTLVKLDVQGYEDRVIAGAQETLSRVKAIIIEVNLDELYEGQATFESLVRSLASLGFRYAGNLDQVHGSDGHVAYVDSIFLR